MKIALIALSLLTCAYASKPVDRNKDIYQFVWGSPPPLNMTIFGKMEKRELPKQSAKERKEQIEEAQYASDLERGSNMIYWGILCAIICVVLHLATSSQHMIAGKFSKLFEWGIVGGVAMIIGGAVLKKAIEYESGIAIASILGVGVFLSRDSVRKWSVSHVFQWFRELPARSESQPLGSVPIDEVEFVCDTHSTDCGEDTPSRK